jgi:hypothetical protein
MDFTKIISYAVIGFAGLLLLLLILCVILIILLVRVTRLDKCLNVPRIEKKEFPNYKHTAIIIEPRNHKALSFVLKNIQDNLPDWGIVLFHGNQNKSMVNSLNLTRTTLVQLPLDNMTKKQYTEFMKSSFFFENVPTELFLIVQCDGMIIPRYKHVINDFLKYDYIGGPVDDRVGDGGFSLRRKSKMMDILNTSPPKRSLAEDMVFSSSTQLKKPSVNEAARFCLQSVWSSQSFGCHKPWKYFPLDQLFAEYPEIKELYDLQ